jgi:hypothetical protein
MFGYFVLFSAIETAVSYSQRNLPCISFFGTVFEKIALLLGNQNWELFSCILLYVLSVCIAAWVLLVQRRYKTYRCYSSLRTIAIGICQTTWSTRWLKRKHTAIMVLTILADSFKLHAWKCTICYKLSTSAFALLVPSCCNKIGTNC